MPTCDGTRSILASSLRKPPSPSRPTYPSARHAPNAHRTARQLSLIHIYTCKFPRAIPCEARPQITIQPEDQQGFYMLLTASAIISGGQVTGYVLNNQGGAAPSTIEFTVFVKEQIDQVHYS